MRAEISKNVNGPKRTKEKFIDAAIQCAIPLICLIWVLPMVVLIAESFRGGSVGGMTSIFRGFGNYVRLFRETAFLKWFGKTFLVGIAVAVVQTVFQLQVGYALSRFRFCGRKFLMEFLFVLGACPGFVTVIAVNILLHGLNSSVADAPYGAIFVYAASSGAGYSVAKSFFDTVDRSVIEAAQIDGASHLQIFLKIFLPIARPIILYTLLMGFMMPWSDLSVADAVLPGTLGEGARQVAEQDVFALFCAGGVVVSVPIVILFLLLQKYYVLGETVRTTGSPRPIE